MSGNRPILPKCIGVQDGSVHSARERSILLSEPEGDAWAGPGLGEHELLRRGKGLRGMASGESTGASAVGEGSPVRSSSKEPLEVLDSQL